MKINIVYLLLIALLGITVSASIAQQNQNVPKMDAEVEKLKNRVSELEGKLQTVENVEKMELAAKLAEAKAKHAEAYAKLIETEFDKLKGELRESNNDWLRGWSGWFLTIIGIFAAILLGVSYVYWYWLNSKTDKLIANEVEKSLTGFQDGLKQVDILKSQLRILQKHYVVSVIENYLHFSADQSYYSEILNTFPEQALIDAFCDEKFPISVKHVAAKVLANMQSTQFVSPAVEFLNSVDLDLYLESDHETHDNLRNIVNFIGQKQTREAYEGLKKFMNRLLTENPDYKQLFLTSTVFSLAEISTKLGIGELSSEIKNVIRQLEFSQRDPESLMRLAVFFDKFNEPEGIKELFYAPLTLVIGLTDVEEKCLELLRKHDPDFVENWLELRETPETESEESDESKPTT